MTSCFEGTTPILGRKRITLPKPKHLITSNSCMFLLFSPVFHLKFRDFAYYEPRTSFGVSLVISIPDDELCSDTAVGCTASYFV